MTDQHTPDTSQKASIQRSRTDEPCACGYEGPHWDGDSRCAHCGGVRLDVLSPAEIDTRWAEALRPVNAADGKAKAAQSAVMRRQENSEEGERFDLMYGKSMDAMEAEWQDLSVEADRLFRKLNSPFVAEWDRRGTWTRYYLVSGGHLHKSGCHTLTPGRTLVGMLPEASGLSADQVVERFNYTACTHCFPNAPVAPERTPEQDGFCPRSGQPITDEQRAALDRRYPGGWHNFAVARSVRCECGGLPSITKTDKVRKHKPGTPQ